MHWSRLFAATVLLACVFGCSKVSPTSPTSVTPSSPASYTLSGTLFETADGISRPLPERSVFFWIQESNGGRTQWVSTDQTGRYIVQVPRSRVFAVAAHPPDQQQPCLASAMVDRDTTLDVEVAPTGSSTTPPAAASPLITGFVYETTPQGRTPVRGVYVSVDAANDAWVANTQTDDTGRFFLCRVNTPVQMVVSLSGYQDVWKSIGGTNDMAMEIELKR
jgi:hypothetical protein